MATAPDKPVLREAHQGPQQGPQHSNMNANQSLALRTPSERSNPQTPPTAPSNVPPKEKDKSYQQNKTKESVAPPNEKVPPQKPGMPPQTKNPNGPQSSGMQMPSNPATQQGRVSQGKGQKSTSSASGAGGGGAPKTGKQDYDKPGSKTVGGSSSDQGPFGSSLNYRGQLKGAVVTREFFQQLHLLRQRAEDVRETMKNQKIDTGIIDKTIANIKKLEQGQAYKDTTKAFGLEETVVEDLKAVEFYVRRQAEKESVKPALGGSSDVPAEFKPLVDQYYKSIAERP